MEAFLASRDFSSLSSVDLTSDEMRSLALDFRAACQRLFRVAVIVDVIEDLRAECVEAMGPACVGMVRRLVIGVEQG